VSGFTLELHRIAKLHRTFSRSPTRARAAYGDIFLDEGFDTENATFAGLANAALISENGYQLQISYFDDPLTPSFETNAGDGENWFSYS
jgi:hypothetical protein